MPPGVRDSKGVGERWEGRYVRERDGRKVRKRRK